MLTARRMVLGCDAAMRFQTALLASPRISADVTTVYTYDSVEVVGGKELTYRW